MRMKTRMILSVGFVAGYYLGARAGRQRYEQMNRIMGMIRRSTPAHMAADKAKEVAADGMHTAKDKVSHKLHHKNGASPSVESMEFSPS